MAASPAGTVGTVRADMQDWTNFALFLRTAEWDLLMGQETQLRKIDGLSRFMALLGLRHPSEKTMAAIAALLAAVSGGNVDDNAATQVALLSTVKSVVKTACTRARQLDTPIHGGFLQVLPASVDLLPLDLRNNFFNRERSSHVWI